MRVEDVMTKNVWTCRAEEPLSTAAKLMWDHDIGAVPVVGDDNRLVGIVTDRDVCMAAYFTGAALASLPIAHAMSKTVFTVGPSQDLQGAEKLMSEKQVRRLPVLDRDKVVGMITVGDLARASKAPEQVSGGEVSATLAAIMQPRGQPVAAATA
jgi:predicted transcriptional regulator